MVLANRGMLPLRSPRWLHSPPVCKMIQALARAGCRDFFVIQALARAGCRAFLVIQALARAGCRAFFVIQARARAGYRDFFVVAVVPFRHSQA
eukprot:24855-Chlamydomonas_euryale.AAC.1